jgi:cbb3-type cytochrome oxidase subunit 3
MDDSYIITYLLLLIFLFGGILVWAFSRKRKKRFEDDARIPFKE